MGGENKKNLESNTMIGPSSETQLIELMATSAWLTGLPTLRGERDEDIQDYLKVSTTELKFLA